MFVVVEAMPSLAVEYPEARSSQVMLYPFPARRQVTVAVEASAGGITASANTGIRGVGQRNLPI
jgi:hypothetical protein